MSTQGESCKVLSDLEVELEQLSFALEEKGAELRGIIKDEKQRKEAELQVKGFIIFHFSVFLFICHHMVFHPKQST